MSEDQVQTLFDITASCVSNNLGHFSKRSIADLPVPVLCNLVDFLSPQHLEEHEDIFRENGIEVSRAWLAHLMKRYIRRYQNRSPTFKVPLPPDYKHAYFRKHFQDCLQAYLTDSAFDPSTPLQQPLRNEPTFLAKPMEMSVLKEELVKYAGYANGLVTRSTLCQGITTHSNLMKALRKSTKVLETFVRHFSHNQGAVVGEFNKLCQDLRVNGCLEELHIHVFGPKIQETLIEIVQACAGQSTSSVRPKLKSLIPFMLDLHSTSHTSFFPDSDNASSEDLYDEALSTLASRRSEREFQQLLEATERQAVDDNSVIYSASSPDFPKSERSAQGRQLKGFGCYDFHCCGEIARELAFILMAWSKLERLAIQFFGGAGSNILVAEENDPDFALLCQVLLHKVRQHQLTQLVLIEHPVQHGPLLGIVKFYTNLIGVLNQYYAISSCEERPLEYLRIPIVCALGDTQLFGGQKIKQPVRAVEDLKVELNPAYPQNRDLAAQHMAAFVTSFIKFDLALTSLTIKDSATYGFRPTDEDILTICSAITERKQLTVLELDVTITSQVAVRAVVDMLGKNQSLTSVNLLRMSVDWEDKEVRDLQETLVSVIKDHQMLNSLTLKGRLGRALKGTFLVGFVVSVFQGHDLPKLKYLDISESGLTTDDVLRMVAELKMSPCAKYFPALELFTLRNTVTCPNVSLNQLTRVKQGLKAIAHNVEITFEEMYGFQAEMMAQV